MKGSWRSGELAVPSARANLAASFARLGCRWVMPAGGSSESEAVHYSFVIVAALLIVGTVCLGESVE